MGQMIAPAVLSANNIPFDRQRLKGLKVDPDTGRFDTPGATNPGPTRPGAPGPAASGNQVSGANPPRKNRRGQQPTLLTGSSRDNTILTSFG
jgi:hypothetical protein